MALRSGSLFGTCFFRLQSSKTLSFSRTSHLLENHSHGTSLLRIGNGSVSIQRRSFARKATKGSLARDATKKIAELLSAGFLSNAEDKLKDMKKNELAVDQVPYLLLLRKHSEEGNYLEVKRIYEQMKADGHRVTLGVFNVLLRTFGKCRNLELLRNTWNEFKSMTPPIQPSSATFWYLHQGELPANEFHQDFFKYLDRCRRERVRQGMPRKMWTLAITIYSQNGQIEKALQIIDEMNSKKTKPISPEWTTILKAIAATKNLELLFQKFQIASQAKQTNYMTCYVTAKALHSANDPRAQPILQEMQTKWLNTGSIPYSPSSK